MKKISIITINLNNAEGLRKTIESVIYQDCFDDIEYIVVDDGSTDGSVSVIREYESQLAFWTHRPNKGIYPTMNEGTSHASAEYCLFLNSGDVLHDRQGLSKMISLMNGEDILIGKTMFMATGNFAIVDRPISLKYFFERTVPHNAALIRRELLLKNPYDESFRIVSDWIFFMKALVVDNASYRVVDVHVADFDCTGISSRNRYLCEIEKDRALKEIFPERVLTDYHEFLYGEGYSNDSYDKFYHKLKDYKYSSVLYSMNVALLRAVSVFLKGAKFARLYPLKMK